MNNIVFCQNPPRKCREEEVFLDYCPHYDTKCDYICHASECKVISVSSETYCEIFVCEELPPSANTNTILAVVLSFILIIVVVSLFVALLIYKKLRLPPRAEQFPLIPRSEAVEIIDINPDELSTSYQEVVL